MTRTSSINGFWSINNRFVKRRGYHWSYDREMTWTWFSTVVVMKYKSAMIGFCSRRVSSISTKLKLQSVLSRSLTKITKHCKILWSFTIVVELFQRKWTWLRLYNVRQENRQAIFGLLLWYKGLYERLGCHLNIGITSIS